MSDTGGSFFSQNPFKKLNDFWVGDSEGKSGITCLDFSSNVAMLALVLDQGVTETTAQDAYNLGQKMVDEKRIRESL